MTDKTEPDIREVMLAQPYHRYNLNPGGFSGARESSMGSFGDARYMLLDQSNFPHTFEYGKDEVASADSDRMLMWNREEYEKVCKEYLESGGTFRNFGQPDGGDLLKFMSQLMIRTGGAKELAYTGYRLLGSVNAANGYPIYHYHVFYKHPDTKTKVYSGLNAPNVKGYGEKIQSGKQGYYYPDF